VRILCIGDSISKGGGFPGGYRRPLQEHLRDAGWEFLFVGGSQLNSEGMQQPFHEGHSGFRIQMIRDGAKTENSENSPLPETLERHRPDLVLLLIGTNDMYLGDPRECAAITEELMDLIQVLGCMTKKWGFKLLLPRSLRNDLISDNSARR